MFDRIFNRDLRPSQRVNPPLRTDADQRLIDSLKADNADLNREVAQTGVLLTAAYDAHREIARQETRTANATVKRMAGIARAALEVA